MSLSQSPVVKFDVAPSALSHIHTSGESCPTCDQPIPFDRFEEIKERIGSRQAAQATQIAARLHEQFKREKAEALEEAGREAAATLASTVARERAEERKAADAAANQKLADAERANRETRAEMQARIDQAEAEKLTAEQSGNALRAALSQSRLDHEAAIRKVVQEAEANAVTIRADAVKEAEAAVQERIADMDRTRLEAEAAFQARIAESEAAMTAAEQSGSALRAELSQSRLDHEMAIQKVRQEAEANAVTIRADAVKEAEAAVQEKLVSAEQAKADAEAKAVGYEQQVQTLKDAYEADVVQRLNEQREILEKAQADAVNVEKSASFQKELKLQEKVDQLQRALDNKTSEELGEGAEIDLYEDLKREFEGDKIERINKGQPGADILQTVIHNGKECGSIIYDSKNHNAWRNDFVTKLAADQMGAKAEHAVLSTRKFPAGKRHLHVQDGVILAAPSRVLALIQILRQHIVQTHTLRWSNEARAQKTVALYAFINSERCRDLFKRIDTQAEKLLDLQVKEKKAHEANWKTQGELIRTVQKVQAEVINEIDSIVGTADTLEQAVHE